MPKEKIGLDIKDHLCGIKSVDHPDAASRYYIASVDETFSDEFGDKTSAIDGVDWGIIEDFPDEHMEAGHPIEASEAVVDSRTQDEHLTKATDPLSRYFHELGYRSLLSREEEKRLAKRIQEGRKAFRAIVLQSPVAIREVVRLGQKLKDGELRLEDVFSERAEEYSEMGEERSLRRICKTIDHIESSNQKVKRLEAKRQGNKRRLERAQRIMRSIHDLFMDLNLSDNQIQRIANILKCYAQQIKDAEEEIRACGKSLGLPLKETKKLLHPEDMVTGQFDNLFKASGIPLDLLDVMGQRVNQAMREIHLVETESQASGSRLKRDAKKLIECESEIEAAKNEFIEANLRLVISIAKKYTKHKTQLPDLIQEGNIGLMHAVERFDYRLGFKFSSYAIWWIRQAITRAIVNQSRTIRIPVHVVDSINKVMRTSRQLAKELGRDPNPEEIAAEMELPTEKVRDQLKLAETPLSLETPIGEHGDSQLADFIKDKKALSPDRVTVARDQADQTKRFLSILSPREEKIIRKRYGIGEEKEHTLEEVAENMGVTRERVRQIEAKALKKLRRVYLQERSKISNRLRSPVIASSSTRLIRSNTDNPNYS